MKKIADFKKLSNIFESERNVKIIIIVGFSIIAFIMLSDFFAPSDNARNVTAESKDADNYISELEERLSKIVSEIEGVGSVNIMLTLESFDESVNIGTKSGTLVQTPVVRGVAVICSGGGDMVIKEKVVETVSKVLGISSSKVCVTK